MKDVSERNSAVAHSDEHLNPPEDSAINPGHDTAPFGSLPVDNLIEFDGKTARCKQCDENKLHFAFVATEDTNPLRALAQTRDHVIDTHAPDEHEDELEDELSVAEQYQRSIEELTEDPASVIMPQRFALSYGHMEIDRFIEAKAQGGDAVTLLFCCALCDVDGTRVLGDARSHLLRSHSAEFAAFVADYAQQSAQAPKGQVFGDNFFDQINPLDYVCRNCDAFVAPLVDIRRHVRRCIPDFEALEAADRAADEQVREPANLQHTYASFGQRVEDEFLTYVGDRINDQYACQLCTSQFAYLHGADLNALGRARRHVRTAHEEAYAAAIADPTSHADKVFFGAYGSHRLDQRLRETGTANQFSCAMCGKTAFADELVELRRHVATQHPEIDDAFFVPPFMISTEYTPGGSTTVNDTFCHTETRREKGVTLYKKSQACRHKIVKGLVVVEEDATGGDKTVRPVRVCDAPMPPCVTTRDDPARMVGDQIKHDRTDRPGAPLHAGSGEDLCHYEVVSSDGTIVEQLRDASKDCRHVVVEGTVVHEASLPYPLADADRRIVKNYTEGAPFTYRCDKCGVARYNDLQIMRDHVRACDGSEVSQHAAPPAPPQVIAARRLSELSFDTGNAAAPIFHQKCGEHFGELQAAIEHVCRAEELSDDERVLHTGKHLADRSARERERHQMRAACADMGLHATKAREAIDDVFDRLARITAQLDEEDRVQRDQDGAFDQKVAQIAERRRP